MCGSIVVLQNFYLINFSSFYHQVVAGLLYDVVVDFTPPAKACEVLHFQIGDRFGKLSLLVNEALTNACTV